MKGIKRNPTGNLGKLEKPLKSLGKIREGAGSRSDGGVVNADLRKRLLGHRNQN